MAFWNPWNLKMVEVVSDFPFSGPNPDRSRFSVCSAQHQAALCYAQPLHIRWQEGRKETIEVSGAFPHHYSWKESQWREAIKVHKLWQELLMIKRLEEMIRGSMKETTNEVHQMWHELFHIRWRFMKGIAIERSHSIAQSVARDFQDQETWSTIRGSMQERNHSSAQFVTGTFPHCLIKDGSSNDSSEDSEEKTANAI